MLSRLSDYFHAWAKGWLILSVFAALVLFMAITLPLLSLIYPAADEIVTGAGGGIGYEAARSLLWLGSKVIIAEINPKTGQQAAQRLNQKFGPGVALFVRTDVGDESSVKNLARRAEKTYGQVDIVLNNATFAPLGAVKAAFTIGPGFVPTQTAISSLSKLAAMMGKSEEEMSEGDFIHLVGFVHPLCSLVHPQNNILNLY